MIVKSKWSHRRQAAQQSARRVRVFSTSPRFPSSSGEIDGIQPTTPSSAGGLLWCEPGATRNQGSKRHHGRWETSNSQWNTLGSSREQRMLRMLTKPPGIYCALISASAPLWVPSTAPADFLSRCQAGGCLGGSPLRISGLSGLTTFWTQTVASYQAQSFQERFEQTPDWGKPAIAHPAWVSPGEAPAVPGVPGVVAHPPSSPLHPQPSALYTMNVHGRENNCSVKIENTPPASCQGICIFGRGSYFFLRLRVRSF